MTTPPQHWPNHHTLRIPPPGVRRDPLPGAKRLPVSLKEQMERDFKAEMLRPKSPIDTMLLRLPELPPVIVKLNRFGQTALVGTVLRPPQADVECITLCLAAIDPSDDDAALAAVRNLLLPPGEERAPVISAMQQLLQTIRQEPRPLGAHIHLDEQSYDSQAVRVVTTAMAESFFDQFGADKMPPQEQPPSS